MEEDPPGTDFLATVCQDWEASCEPAAQAGVRVVNVRTGIVLSAGGGVLQRLLPLYLAGAPTLEGPVNGVAPEPVTAEEFAHTLGGVLRRPAKLKVPAAGPRLLLGTQGAAELALASQRASSAKAQKYGYRFRHTSLEVVGGRSKSRSLKRFRDWRVPEHYARLEGRRTP